jgi:hypothetical protein
MAIHGQNMLRTAIVNIWARVMLGMKYRETGESFRAGRELLVLCTS